MPEPSVSLLICTTPRSGSTYFANTLRSAGCFGMPEEWLHPYNYEPLLARKGLTPEVPVRTLINCIWERATTDNGVFAVKTMWDRFEILLQKAREEYENSGTLRGSVPDRLDWPCVRDLFPDSRIILLTRRDRVGQAVSYIRAHQTGVWHRIEGSKAGVVDTIPNGQQRNYFDPAFIKLIMDNFAWQEESWRKLFWLECIKPLEIEYESFVQNKSVVVRQVAALMGISTDAVNDAVEVANKPVHDTLNKQWRSLYAELVTGPNGFNELLPSAHWLFAGRHLTIETPYPVIHGEAGSVVDHYVAMRNPTLETISIHIQEDGQTVPTHLKLQAVWKKKQNAIHREIGAEVILSNEWGAEAFEVCRLSIRIPDDPDQWVLRIFPVMASERCDYRLLGVEPIRMRFYKEALF